jgi:pimeloyl-ACP methyl ester carboxylesterase
VLVRTLREATAREHWEEWERVECPTLVVRAGRGYFEAPYMEAVASRARQGSYAEVPDAGHDLHLEDPLGWRRAVEGFASA